MRMLPFLVPAVLAGVLPDHFNQPVLLVWIARFPRAWLKAYAWHAGVEQPFATINKEARKQFTH